MSIEKLFRLSCSPGGEQPVRVLIVGFSYIIGVYQSKLKSIQNTGAVDVGWLAPKKWKMRSWNRIIPLEMRVSQIRVYPVNIRFLNGVNGGYLYPTLRMLRAINQFKPDILHYEQEAFSLSAFQIAFWARALEIPLTIFCWENMEKAMPCYRRWTTRFVLEVARAVVAGSNEAADLVRNWGYKDKIAVMPQIGVDTNLFFPRPKLRRDRVIKLAYVGRLVPEKGVDLLLDAAKKLLEGGLPVQLTICGSGNHEPELRSHAEHLGIGEHVLWFGPINHDAVPDVLAQADVVVLPSRTLPGIWKEQFGHVLIEAMAMGIPVVGSDCGAIPEVIGRADLIFPENNSSELAQILRRFIVDDEWTTEVSEFLKERAIREYSDQKIADRLTLLWREIAGRGHDPSFRP